MSGGLYNPIKIGPFVGGMNTISDSTAILDNEVLDCVNLELDLDGSCVVRPPVTDSAGAGAWGANGILLLGYFTFATGTYLIGSNSTGTYFKLGAGAWTLISANLQATSAVQYFGFVWILATNGSTTASGKWNPSAGFAIVAGMPRGQTILIYKDRGFAAAGETAPSNSSRLYFSKSTDLTDWTSAAAGFIDINPGDGQDLVDIIVYQNTIVCLKQNSTYVFSFTTAPSDGAVRVVSTTIGVFTHHCAVIFETILYLYHDGRIYEVLKFNFGCINVKVSFVYDGTSIGTFANPIFLTVFGTRLLVRYYHRVYAFGFRTRTWSRWETSEYFGPMVLEPVNPTAHTFPRYFAGSCITTDTKVYMSQDGYDNVQSELMTGTILTKIYDMSHQIRVGRYFISQQEKWKRQFWWGAQIQTANSVKGTCLPITVGVDTIWGSLSATPWNALKTWGYPVTAPLSVINTIPFPDSQFSRFARFPKGLRFRRIRYQMDITTHGTVNDGPDRIFSLTIMVGSRGFVAEQVA